MSNRYWLTRGVLMVSTALLAWWLGLGCSRSPALNEQESKKKPPVAQVKLVPAKESRIANLVTAYGSVIAQPGKSHSVSVLFECRVRHVLVAPGQSVTNGQVLAEIAPSAGTELQLAEAKAAVEAANRELEQTQERLKLRLVTNQELGRAESAARTAQLRLQSLESEGVESVRGVGSDMTGLVEKVAVQDGQIVPAGGSLVELVAGNEIEVKLGVEPEDAVYLSKGQTVRLYPVQTEPVKPIEGQIRLITDRVNPATRLVDVYASPPRGTRLLLNLFMRAEIETQAHIGLVVPRAAVLPQNHRQILYTVAGGHAVEHQVQIGLEMDAETELVGSPLKPGQLVVGQGNFELTNGMAVDILDAR